jgi:hypothetical protein
MDDDVAHRPSLTPGTGVGSALLHRVQERPPLRESIVIDVSLHGVGYTRRAWVLVVGERAQNAMLSGVSPYKHAPSRLES